LLARSRFQYWPIGLFAFAALLFAAAEYEHMTGSKWALASIALTLTVERLFALSFILVLPAQFGLFCALAYANIQRKKKFELEREARAEEDRRMRQERAKVARDKAEQGQAQPLTPIKAPIPQAAIATPLCVNQTRNAQSSASNTPAMIAASSGLPFLGSAWGIEFGCTSYPESICGGPGWVTRRDASALGLHDFEQSIRATPASF
jgi:hypothetical protein